ncbi:MAG TPA: peptidylprolyl isomerase [Verrucomicrobiae bacterium]|nr:peptidylprolyl isomerase [Verrucomicrobiae bacterium]
MRFVLLLTLVAGLVSAAFAGEPLDRIVVVIDDGVVLQSELDRAMEMSRKQLGDRKIALPPESVLRTQVLERLVLTRVQTQRAQQAGIRVDDRELNEVLGNLASQNKMTLQQFAEAVKKEGMEYLALREQVRDEITINRLRAREIDQRVLVTEQDIDLFLANRSRLDQTEYRVSHILVAVPDGASSEVRTKARAKADRLLKQLQEGADFAQMATANSDGQQALQGGDLEWRSDANLPELFANAVQKLKPGELSPVLQNASGFHILKLADQRGGDQRKTVTETRSQHVLLQPNALRNEEQTKQAARALHERLKKGEDFGEVAKKNSDDTGSKNSGGDLGWQPSGVFAPEFEKAIDSLKPGELTAPFRTSFGWHIAKVNERRVRDTTDQTRRARARQAIQNRKASEEYDMWLRRLRAEAYVEYRQQQDAKPQAAS